MSLGRAALAPLKRGEEAEEVSQLSCVESGDKLLRPKKGPWRKQRYPPEERRGAEVTGVL